MNSHIIKLPATITANNAQSTFAALAADYDTSFSPNIDRVIFDFSACKAISPVGLLYIRMWRDTLIEKGKAPFYRKSDPQTNNFLTRMRLLPNPDKADDTTINEKFFYSIHSCMSTDDCIIAHKDIISEVIAKDKVNSETYAALDYMLNELWDNAGVHGYECYHTDVYPKPVYICALEFEDCYEVCIGDRGQGIYSSLQKNNDKIKGQSKKSSIKAAIQNGISGHPDGSPGFGLYCAAEFMRGGNGELNIWSSGCYLFVSSKDDRIYNSAFSKGTLISFVINKDTTLPFETILNSHSKYKRSTQEYIEEVIGGLFDEQ